MSALEGEHGDSILMALELERAGGEDAAISGLYGCATVCHPLDPRAQGHTVPPTGLASAGPQCATHWTRERRVCVVGVSAPL